MHNERQKEQKEETEDFTPTTTRKILTKTMATATMAVSITTTAVLLHVCHKGSHCYANYLDGLVVKASASRAEDPGFESSLRWDFSGSSHISDLNIGTPVATSQAPGVIGSALRLVDPVSVYCD